MLSYLFRRLLAFIPTLILISMLTFALSKCTPGDPVEKINQSDGLEISGATEARYYERSYANTARNLGLDKPPFYFSLTSIAYPDTLYKYIQQDKREVLQKLIAQYGNWPDIEKYYHQIRVLDFAYFQVPDSLQTVAFNQIRSATQELYLQDAPGYIDARLKTIQDLLQKNSLLVPLIGNEINQLTAAFENVKNNPTRHSLWVPRLQWNGFNNQYHFWVSNFITGNFGISYVDSRPVSRKIGEAIGWTLIINLLALLFVFGIAIPIGVTAAAKKDSRFDKVSSLLLFMFYSLPSFWIATLLVVFFTTSEYGMNWFASIGLGDVPFDSSLWTRLVIRTPHLILPVFCVAYTGLAFVSRQMRGGMLQVLKEDYIRTARAKGLDNKKVIWRHAFRNALFPIITLVAGILPAMIAGSVIIEVIFNIPGMGRLIFDSINNEDWPVVYTVLMLGALLTMLGILISDILYAKADPRVSFQKMKTDE